MNHIKPVLRRYLSVAGLTALIFLPATTQVLAAPGTLAQVPLYVGPNVEPNVVFLNDDSGSMEFTIMAPEDGGAMWLGGEDYFYTHPTRSGSNWRGQNYSYSGSGTLSVNNGQARVVPTVEALNYCFGAATTNALGVWRAWNHNYNKVYYNPTIRYTPWVGVNINGAAYGNINPSAALINPYNPAAGTENLTANRAYTTRFPMGVNKSGCANAHNDWTISTAGTNYAAFYPARYYIWSDTNGNGLVDADDDHKLVEITNTATALTPSPPASYTGGPGRTDCADPSNCTYAEEIQNFANWYGYYRSRDYTAKNAATAAIEGVTGVRVGYATINNNTSARFRVASMNADPVTGNKRNLFNRIYGAMPGAGVGTPLRTALHQTGLYYECKSGNIMAASGAVCPILPAAQGGMCQKNYTILMTDGFWNDTSNPGISPGNADGNNNTAWDGPPYGDSYSFTLADVAMHYYERDLNPSLVNEVPSSTGAKDNAPHQHMTTYTVAFGVTGTLNPEIDDPTAPGFSWPNPSAGDAEKIDDLWHAAYNGRGEFFNAQDPATLEEGLKSAFASVARGKSSSASVAFNTTKLGTDSMLYQASFNPSDNWSGALTAISLSIDGLLENEAWNAAPLMDQVLPDSRVILTYNESNLTGIPFRTMATLSTRQQNDLNMGPAGIDGLGQARLDYLRGDRSNEGPENGHEFRERSALLGDIVYSNPVYVGRPELGYENDPSFGDGEYNNFIIGNTDRMPVVYVGSNGGKLHGFSATSGQEVIAYVPNKLFSNQSKEGLHYLTDPGYEHRYYADLSPTVSDVYIGGAWRTILIGGYRAGGRGLFALDVTNPASFSEANADDIVVWEFTNDDHADLGHSFSKPTMALLENDQWAAIFGNGYNDLGSGIAKLYILFLEQGMDGVWSAGSDYRVISTTVGSTADRNGLSTPVLVDSDGNGKADRVYAGDLMGNMWAFDLSSANQSNWDVAYIQGGTRKALFNATVGGVQQPITAKPVVARNPQETTVNNNKPNILVFFGTGQYLVNGDKNSTGTQSFYGVWDNGSPASALPRTRASLVAQTLDLANSTPNERVTTDNPVSFGTQYGWRFDLPALGERVVVDPKVRGDYVFFNTLIPDPNTCNTKGHGWLMALKLANGGSPPKPVFDVNNDGKVNDEDLVNGAFPPSGVLMDGIPAGSNFLDDMMYTPDDEGNIDIRRINAGISFDSGRISWREVRQ